MSELQNVKPGDLLYTTMAWNTKQIYLHKVERVTKTQIITTNGERIRKQDGCIVGSSNDVWLRRQYHIATPDVIEKHTRQLILDKICDFFKKPSTVDLPIDELRKVLAIIESHISGGAE